MRATCHKQAEYLPNLPATAAANRKDISKAATIGDARETIAEIAVAVVAKISVVKSPKKLGMGFAGPVKIGTEIQMKQSRFEMLPIASVTSDFQST